MKSPLPLKNVQRDQQVYRSRIWFAGAFVAFCFIILVSRYTYLQVFKYGQYNTASDNNRIRLQALPPARGYIYDRNGILLADNYPIFTAVISRTDIENIEDTLHRLVPVLELTTEDITRFRSRAKTTRKSELLAVKLDLTERQIARFSELKHTFTGVSIQTKMTRYYPHNELFAHVIGYVGRINEKELGKLDKNAYAGTDLIGKIGVEKYYEDLLHGKPGYQYIEADAHGQVIRHLGQTPAVRGNDVYKCWPTSNSLGVVVQLSPWIPTRVRYWLLPVIRVSIPIYLCLGLAIKTIVHYAIALTSLYTIARYKAFIRLAQRSNPWQDLAAFIMV
jgi:penicillin-binding protein 2